MDFSKENLDNMMSDYEPLLCDSCREGLKVAGEPIRERLNDGKPPKMRHVQKMLRVLCPRCTSAIALKENSRRGGR
jgi:hypothetical protein